MEQFHDQFFNFLFLKLHSQISALRLSQFEIFWQQDKSCCIKIVQVARKWKISVQNYTRLIFWISHFIFHKNHDLILKDIKVGEIRFIQFWHNWYHIKIKIKITYYLQIQFLYQQTHLHDICITLRHLTHIQNCTAISPFQCRQEFSQAVT